MNAINRIIKCSKCKVDLDVNQFSKNKNNKSGLSNQCKKCKKEYDTVRLANGTHSAIKTYLQRKADGTCTRCGGLRNDNKTKCINCSSLANKLRKNYHIQLKTNALNAYGGLKCSCPKCDESHISILTIDHINGGGSEHRENVKRATGNPNIYKWLRDNSYPPGYRVFCFNCNYSTYLNGRCHHIFS